jgi:hypothetical protein
MLSASPYLMCKGDARMNPFALMGMIVVGLGALAVTLIFIGRRMV